MWCPDPSQLCRRPLTGRSSPSPRLLPCRHQSYARLQPCRRVPDDRLRAPMRPAREMPHRRPTLGAGTLISRTRTTRRDAPEASDRSTCRGHRARGCRCDPLHRAVRLGSPRPPRRIAERRMQVGHRISTHACFHERTPFTTSRHRSSTSNGRNETHSILRAPDAARLRLTDMRALSRRQQPNNPVEVHELVNLVLDEIRT